MELVSFKNKTTKSFNTGNAGSVLEMGKPVAIVMHPEGDSLTQDDIDDIRAGLQAKMFEAAKDDRYYMIGTFGEAEDRKSDAKTQEYGYGYSKTIEDGQHMLMLTLLDGDLITHEIMRRYNGQHRRFRMMIIDDGSQEAKTKLFGTKFLNSATGNMEFRGYKLANIYTPIRPTNTGEGVKYGLEVTLASSVEYNDQVMGIELGFDAASELKKVTDVALSEYTRLTGAIVDILGTTAKGQDNFFEENPTILAGAGANLTCVRKSNGATVNITASALTLVNGAYVARLTFSTTTNPLPTTPGDIIILSLDDVPTLNTAGFEGYESNRLEIEIP